MRSPKPLKMEPRKIRKPRKLLPTYRLYPPHQELLPASTPFKFTFTGLNVVAIFNRT
jgi:hypothetical protein